MGGRIKLPQLLKCVAVTRHLFVKHVKGGGRTNAKLERYNRYNTIWTKEVPA